jgi:hypothetical protein
MCGGIQFGCICSNGDNAYDDDHNLAFSPEGTSALYTSSYYDKYLQVELFVNGEAQLICQSPSDPLEKSKITRNVAISSAEPTVLVCVYTLRNVHDDFHVPAITKESSLEIEKYLAIKTHSEDMTDRLWAVCVIPEYDNDEADEVCSVARNVEEILGVSSLPVSDQVSKAYDGYSTPTRSRSKTKQTTEDVDLFGTPTAGGGIALVRNIMTSQYVDLQSAL